MRGCWVGAGPLPTKGSKALWRVYPGIHYLSLMGQKRCLFSMSLTSKGLLNVGTEILLSIKNESFI